MKHRVINRLTRVGFLLCYFAALGSIVVIVMPMPDAVQGQLLWFIMLPAGIVGLAILVFEKAQTPADT